METSIIDYSYGWQNRQKFYPHIYVQNLPFVVLQFQKMDLYHNKYLDMDLMMNLFDTMK